MTIPASGPLALTDIQTEFGGSNPIGLNEYYAGGTYVPAATSGTYGAVPSSGQISVQNFYGTTAYTPIYVEEVYSNYLYVGTSATQTITNNIDLSTNGGLVWIKDRNLTNSHMFFDTVRGVNNYISSDTITYQNGAYGAFSNLLTAFGTTGFTLGADSTTAVNSTTGNSIYTAWTFREKAKFFDIVTYTGNGANRTIAHNLGSVPGCIIIKRTNTNSAWQVYHGSLANTQYLVFNEPDAKATGATRWNSTTPTSSVFSLGTEATVNDSGSTYIAYLFASDAGGFGLTGSDNIVTCGTFTAATISGNTSGLVTSLGYEPQWLMYKNTSRSENWFIVDTARGFSMAQNLSLFPNLTNSETNSAGGNSQFPAATGFQLNLSGTVGDVYVYVAIRKGPMKVPTVGTSVFTPLTTSSGGVRGTTPFPIDMQIFGRLTPSSNTMNWSVYDRIRSLSTTTITDQYGRQLLTTSTTSENSAASDGYNTQYNNTGYYNQTGSTWSLNFVRATNFLDTICYNGNSTYGATQTHRLGITPEMMWFKCRSTGSTDWIVWHKAFNISDYLVLSGGSGLQTGGGSGTEYFNNTLPTSSVVTLGAGISINMTGRTYVGYVFGTVAGVSKVGSYTGTGAAQTINCGFTTGARFVMIKRAVSGSQGDWYVFDTAKGFTSGNDPWIIFNQPQAQTTGTNYVDPQSTGFTINASAPNDINFSGDLFIFWAIA
jgi:hypothetical protein